MQHTNLGSKELLNMIRTTGYLVSHPVSCREDAPGKGARNSPVSNNKIQLAMGSSNTNNENSDFKHSYHKNRDKKITISNHFKEPRDVSNM